MYIIADFEQIFGIFAGISHCEVEPLVVAESICVVLDEEMVLLLVFFAERTV